MRLTKNVNGVTVEMTPEEEAAHLASLPTPSQRTRERWEDRRHRLSGAMPETLFNLISVLVAKGILSLTDLPPKLSKAYAEMLVLMEDEPRDVP